MLQARLGPQLANVLVKQNDLAKFIARKLGVPEELIGLMMKCKKQAMQIQQMMQLQQAGQGKDMSRTATRTG